MKKPKKLLKKIATLAISLGISVTIAFSFAGCVSDVKQTQDPNIDQTIITPEDPTLETPTPETPSDGGTVVEEPSDESTEEMTMEEAIGKVEEFTSSISQGNFTYFMGDSIVYSFDGDTVALSQDGDVTYFVYEDGVNYAITYDNDEEVWYKNVTEEFDVSAAVGELVSDIVSISYSDYDAENNLLYGMIQERISAVVQVTDSKLTIEFAGRTSVFTSVGTTTVSLPENVVEAETKSIYTIDSEGNYVFDIAAINEVLEPWVKGDNQFGKNIIEAKYGSSYPVTVKKVLYINASEDEIAFGVLFYDDDGAPEYMELYIRDDTLYNGIKDGSIVTQEDFKECLNSIDRPAKIGANVGGEVLEYTTFDDDYASEHQEEFEKLTERVFEKAGVTVDKIYFGFKGPTEGTYASSTYGYGTGWYQYYLVEVDGQMQFLQFRISASVYPSLGAGNAIGNVLEDTDYWGTSLRSTKEIDNGNEALYSLTTSLLETTDLSK